MNCWFSKVIYPCLIRNSKTWLARPINGIFIVLAFSAVFCIVPRCCAKELISLKSGFQIEANSHQEIDGVVTLQLASGTLQFQSSEVARIETMPDVSIPVEPVPSVIQRATPEEIVRKAGESQGTAIEFTELVLSVAKVESGLRQSAISPKGAQGLMQLMPQTASALGVDARKAEQNALGGAAYLRELLDRYGDSAVLALAAYNAGPAAVQKYGGVPPYPETRQYIGRVLLEYSRLEKQRHSREEYRASVRPAP
jgi:Transglycosylase SLT domain